CKHQYFPIYTVLYRTSCTRLNHSEYRDIESLLQYRKSCSRRRITCNDEHFNTLVHQIVSNLNGIIPDIFLAFLTIWASRNITELQNFFMRKLSDDFFDYSHAADTRIPDADRSIHEY